MPIGMILVGAVIAAIPLSVLWDASKKRALQQTAKNCQLCGGGKTYTQQTGVWAGGTDTQKFVWHKSGCPAYYNR